MSLQDSLNDFLEEEVADKHLLKTCNRKGKEELRNPQVVRSGWILPKSIDDEDYAAEEFPYILTRMEKIKHSEGSRESIVTMMILFGIYDPGIYDGKGILVDDGSGYRDFWNLVESTRQALMRQNVIDKKYRINDDFFEAEMYKDQVYPYWEGFCRTKWHVIFPYPGL